VMIFCCTSADIHDPRNWYGPECPECGNLGCTDAPWCTMSAEEYATVQIELRTRQGTDAEGDEVEGIDPWLEFVDPVDLETTAEVGL
jgi:hypothetical protein